MHVLVTCKYKKDRIKKQPRNGGDIIFPIISQWGLSVAMETRVLITQGQVTPKWVVWFGPKSNSTELLCLSWLPATLMMIRSKMNELAWRHHFPIISLRDFFRRSRAANSVVSGPIHPKFELVRDFMHVLVTCKYKKDRIKSNRERLETPFSPIKSQWGISVAIDTRVLIQSISKHYEAFPHLQWCYI